MLLLLPILLFATTALSSSEDANTTIAELQASLPACSLNCIVSGAAAHGCSVADISCMCDQMEAMIKTVSPCLVKAGCNLSDITNTSIIVDKICQVEDAATNSSDANSTTAATATSSTADATASPGAAAILRHSSWAGAAVAAAAMAAFF